MCPTPHKLASNKDPVEFITHICHFGLTYIICNCSNGMVSKGAVVGIAIAVVIVITVITMAHKCHTRYYYHRSSYFHDMSYYYQPTHAIISKTHPIITCLTLLSIQFMLFLTKFILLSTTPSYY